MDGISHLIVGRLVATTQKMTQKHKMLVATFGYLPDLSQIVLYPLLVWIIPRPYYFPANEDWIGIADKHPWFTFAYEFPHSFLFVLLILLPMVWYFQLPKLCILSYISHLILDIFTHTGEWATKILLPSRYYYIEGYTDAWAWTFKGFSLSWAILLGIWAIIYFWKEKYDGYEL